ncbi:Predicted PurR-regulated permease PerM [Modicisalibacter muralis]|uniref:Predicted PurR-regulated permease PerM n=1 Tax=Modicisalibacter muralis TaxID=119000 RepID=A0A1G9NML2_9GAMM|nr:AI-2E family transporter [Halomonas muralis]SDL87826.1 Predicted PurR-regulated permease PerM [Halomonas muralis]
MNPIVHDNTVARWLLVLVLAAGVYFFIGFLVPLLAALIVGFASWPLYRRLHRLCLGSNVLAASIALIIIIVGLVVPISLAFSFALQELKGWIEWLLVANRVGIPTPEWISALPGVGEWLSLQWQEYLSEPNALSSVVDIFSGDHIGDISRWLLAFSGGAFSLLLAIVFMLISLFFIYKDGARLAGQLDIVGERILPARWKRFSRVVPATVSSTVVGMGLIAMGEGVVLGTAYWIAGVPSPVVLGVLTAFMALIPGGAPLTFTLVSLYLLGSGELAAALGLFAWGTTELFIVDKTLRPRLVGGPIKLPFLPTFFGLIGGVKTMGIIGLFVGPVLMALLVAIWHEWLHDADLETARDEKIANASEAAGKTNEKDSSKDSHPA